MSFITILIKFTAPNEKNAFHDRCALSWKVRFAPSESVDPTGAKFLFFSSFSRGLFCFLAEDLVEEIDEMAGIAEDHRDNGSDRGLKDLIRQLRD